MKAKIYVGAKKYALYIGRKIVQKTLEFLTLPARFVSNKVQELKNYLVYGQSVQNGTPTPTTPIEVESVGDRTKNLFDKSSITVGTYITASGGTNRSVYGLTASNKIEVTPQKIYTVSGMPDNNTTMAFNWFDKNDNILSTRPTFSAKRGVNVNWPNTAPDNAKYLYVNVVTSEEQQGDTWQIEEGSTSTSYEPYGYKVPVVVGGKNLFDGEIELGGLDVVTGLEVANPGRTRSSNFISVKPNTTYTFTRTDGANRWVLGYDENKNIVTDGTEYASQGRYGALVQSGSLFKFKFKTTPTTKYIRWYDTGCTNITETMQIEQGDTATSYQPYIEPTTTNIYLSEPLRKIGDYADYIDFEGQKVVRNVEVIDDTGTLPIEQSLRGLAIATEEAITLPAINLEQGTLTIDTDTKIKPSKMIITGDIDNE